MVSVERTVALSGLPSGMERQFGLALGRRGFLQFADQRLDLLVVDGARHHAQLPPICGEGGFRGRNERFERRHIGRLQLDSERVDRQLGLALGRDRFLELGDQRFDLLVVGRASHDPQLPPIGRERRFGARHQCLERGHVGGRQFLCERIDDQCRFFARGGHFLPLVDELLDHRVIDQPRGHRQLTPIGTDRELRIGHQRAQQRQHTPIHLLFQRIHLDQRCVLQRRFLIELFDQRLDHRLGGGRGAHDDAAGLRIGGYVRARHQLFHQGGQCRRVEAPGQVHDHLLARLVDVGAQLLHHRLDLRLVLRFGEHQQTLRCRIDGGLDLGQHRLQLLHQVRRRGGSQSVQRIDLPLRLRLRRSIRLHLVDRRLDRRLLVGRRIRHDVIDLLVDLNLGVGKQHGQHFHGSGRINGRDRIDLKYRRDRRRRWLLRFLRLRQPRFRDRSYQDTDRLQLARRLDDQELAGLRQADTAAVLAQQRFNLLRHRLGRPTPEREQHTDHLEVAALRKFLHRHPRNQVLLQVLREIDQDQHAVALDERESLGQQHAVQQVDRLGGRVLAIVAVRERTCRRLVHDQCQAGLPGEPVEHVVPFLIPEIESQLLRGGHRRQLRPLPLVQHGQQLLIGRRQDLGPLVRRSGHRRRGPLDNQLRHGRPLLAGQFQLIGHGRMRQTLIVKGRHHNRGRGGNRRLVGRRGDRRCHGRFRLGRRIRRAACLDFRSRCWGVQAPAGPARRRVPDLVPVRVPDLVPARAGPVLGAGAGSCAARAREELRDPVPRRKLTRHRRGGTRRERTGWLGEST